MNAIRAKKDGQFFEWYVNGNLGDFFTVKNEQIIRTWDNQKYPHELEKYDYKQ